MDLRGAALKTNNRGKIDSISRRNALMVLGTSAFSLGNIQVSVSSHQPTPLVVLVAIDGVRWQDVFFEPNSFDRASSSLWLPHLQAMRRNGSVLGAPGSDGFFATGPNFVSLPGYMEMLSGSSTLGCTENDCARIKKRTLVDDFEDRSGPLGSGAAVFSSWSKVLQASTKDGAGIASTGRYDSLNETALAKIPDCARLLEEGRASSGGVGAFRHDRLTAELALAYLSAAEPNFVFVSLGETDEAGHQGNFSEYLHALKEADRFIGSLRELLSQQRVEGRQTVLLVTTDHGRSHNFVDHGREHPESSRAFLFAEGEGIVARGRNSSAKGHLRDIAPTIREMSGLRQSMTHGGGRVLSEILA